MSVQLPIPDSTLHKDWREWGNRLVQTLQKEKSKPRDITFRQQGTGAVDRSIFSKTGETVSVKDFGATGDGTTDDTTAVQAAFDAVLANLGGGVFFPAGEYLITNTLGIDISAGDARIWLSGDGNGSAQLTSNFAGDLLQITGGTGTNFHSYMRIDGLNFTGPGSTTVGARGLVMDNTAFFHVDDCTVTGFEYGLVGTDLVSGSFDNLRLRFNSYGGTFSYSNLSRPNALNFFGSTIGNNDNYGLLATGPACLGIIGGSIESNGNTGGDTHRWGLKVSECGVEGALGLAMFNVYCEQNSIDADIWIEQSSYRCAFAILASSFVRNSSTYYCTNNIKLDLTTATNKQTVLIAGCGFDKRGTYTENATRPYFGISGITGNNYNLQTYGNLYGDSTIRPANGPLAQPNGLAQVYVRFSGSAASPSITKGLNASSITKNGTGDYTINYFRALQSASNVYSVQLGSAAGHHTLFAESTTSVRFKTFAVDGTTATDFDNISVVVWSVQPE